VEDVVLTGGIFVLVFIEKFLTANPRRHPTSNPLMEFNLLSLTLNLGATR
jgi:hypothetical protein